MQIWKLTPKADGLGMCECDCMTSFPFLHRHSVRSLSEKSQFSGFCLMGKIDLKRQSSLLLAVNRAEVTLSI